MTSTEAGLILEIQKANHEQNRGDIEALKSDVKDIKEDMASKDDVKSIQVDVASINKTISSWQGTQAFSRWLIASSLALAGVILTALAIFLAYRKEIIHALIQ